MFWAPIIRITMDQCLLLSPYIIRIRINYCLFWAPTTRIVVIRFESMFLGPDNEGHSRFVSIF